MTEIAQPKRPDEYDDRNLDCQFAMEPAFQALLRQAEAAGWSEEDAAFAALDLAKSNIKGILADRQTDADIQSASGISA